MLTLSYSMRVLCVASIGMGVMHVFFDLVFRASLPVTLQMLCRRPARAQERFLFVLMLLPPLAAALSTFLLIVPAFIALETNHHPEDAGLLCLLASSAVWAWYAAVLIRAILTVTRTIRFEHLLERSAARRDIAGHGRAAWVISGKQPLLMLVGVLRPRVLISERLLDPSAFPPQALKVAIEHEYAHARQHDNWKMLAVSLLPTLPYDSSYLPSVHRTWRRYAEWAADDEAVADDRDQALLLAESLLLFARASASPLPGVIATALTGPDRELSMRIQRLLALEKHGASDLRAASPFAIAGFCLSVTSSAGIFLASPFLHAAAEYLLHLG